MDFDIDQARLEMVVDDDVRLEQVVRASCDAPGDVGAVGPDAAHSDARQGEDRDGDTVDAFQMTLGEAVECVDLTAADGSIPVATPSDDPDPTTPGMG
ncbi:MAG: hypothetical protein GY772_29620, partial [bacterium]|nr:hypothetical protein [bacterium]